VQFGFAKLLRRTLRVLHVLNQQAAAAVHHDRGRTQVVAGQVVGSGAALVDPLAFRHHRAANVVILAVGDVHAVVLELVHPPAEEVARVLRKAVNGDQ